MFAYWGLYFRDSLLNLCEERDNVLDLFAVCWITYTYGRLFYLDVNSPIICTDFSVWIRVLSFLQFIFRYVFDKNVDI